MTKKIVLLSLLILLSATINAQDKPVNFSVAFETSSYTYREPALGIKVSGPKYGVSAEYLARNPDTGGLFMAAQILYMTGSVDYTGYLMDGTPHNVSGITDYYYDSRILLGFYANSNQMSTDFWPYLGVGYRRLFNNMGADPSGYDRISTYVYLPVGMRARFKMVDGWSLTPEAEYDLLLSGRQQSGLGEGITNNQKSGYGLRASVRLAKTFGSFNLFAEPFFRYWNIQDSEVAYSYVYSAYFYEPANNTKEYGLKIGIGF